MTEKIKPCPFCGSNKVYVHSDCRSVMYIQCSACRANVYIYPPDEDKTQLFQKWNRRSIIDIDKEDSND